jgi:hypothetical protein
VLGSLAVCEGNSAKRQMANLRYPNQIRTVSALKNYVFQWGARRYPELAAGTAPLRALKANSSAETCDSHLIQRSQGKAHSGNIAVIP